jgi:hypothetical protein
MESPFAKTVAVAFYLEPILNTHYQTYQNVITLSQVPTGPLRDLVWLYAPPKLSAFQEHGSMHRASCLPVLVRYPTGSSAASIKNTDYFMGADDIPSLLGYLSANGYVVDTKLSKLVQPMVGGASSHRLSGNRQMICWATYSGP